MIIDVVQSPFFDELDFQFLGSDLRVLWSVYVAHLFSLSFDLWAGEVCFWCWLEMD